MDVIYKYVLNCAGFPIGQDDPLAHQLFFGSMKFGEDV